MKRARLPALYIFDFFLLYFGREKYRRRHAAGKLGKQLTKHIYSSWELYTLLGELEKTRRGGAWLGRGPHAGLGLGAQSRVLKHGAAESEALGRKAGCRTALMGLGAARPGRGSFTLLWPRMVRRVAWRVVWRVVWRVA